MKTKMFFVVCAMSFTVSAHAARWVLKNPKTISSTLIIQKEIAFGSDRFVVVEDGKDNANRDYVVSLSRAESIEIDQKIRLNDAPAPTTPPIDTAWHVDALKYDQIPKNITGKGVIVAVADTSMEYTHDALKNHMWHNAKEIPANKIDDDKNGYVDDIVGYDFDGKTSDPINNDGAEHATHVAGLIAADQQPDGNARGVAQGVQIMSVKIIGADSTGFLSNAAEGIKYAVDNGAKVISNSWRVYKSWTQYVPNEQSVQVLKAAIQYAESKGVLFVNAAGNESEDISSATLADPIYPTGFRLSNMVVVAATDSTGAISDFSNYGAPVVMVAAPGSEIMSTLPGNTWGAMSGTSMATPITAGTLALGIGAGLSTDEAVKKLIATSTINKAFAPQVLSSGIISPVDFVK